MWIQVSVCIYAGRPSFYLLLTLGKIPESHWLSIVIQVRALNWQPQKLPKQWVSQVEIDPSSLLNQTVSKSSVPSCYRYNLLFDPSAKWKKGRKKERKEKERLAILRNSFFVVLSDVWIITILLYKLLSVC